MHSAEDWDDLLLPEIDRQQAAGTRVAFRADAAFAKPEIYDALEKRAVDDAIRMPANKSRCVSQRSPALEGTVKFATPAGHSFHPSW